MSCTNPCNILVTMHIHCIKQPLYVIFFSCRPSSCYQRHSFSLKKQFNLYPKISKYKYTEKLHGLIIKSLNFDQLHRTELLEIKFNLKTHFPKIKKKFTPRLEPTTSGLLGRNATHVTMITWRHVCLQRISVVLWNQEHIFEHYTEWRTLKSYIHFWAFFPLTVYVFNVHINVLFYHICQMYGISQNLHCTMI